ncbi:MAG: hypothetical protein PHX45_03090 [Acidobacteriota bacterium]|nr:hypothetical protein [Acidobacteriota bacterium]
MKSKYWIVALGVLWLAAGLRAEVNPGGYLSFQFLKGQKQSAYDRGSFEDLLAGFLVSGNIDSNFTFALEARLDGQGAAALDQAWAGVHLSKLINARAGLFLVPFGRYNQISLPLQAPLVRLPLNIEGTYPARWRDIGVCAEGGLGIFSYAAFIGNGPAEGETLSDGQQFRDNNRNKGMGIRGTVLLANSMEAGVSYYLGKPDSEDARDLRLLGLDMRWVTTGYEILAEYTRAELENPAPFSAGTAEGYYVLLAMNFGGIHPTFSYQRFTYDDLVHGAGFVSPEAPGAGISRDLVRWTVGARCLLSDKFLIKAEYDINKEKGITLNDNLLSLQLAFGF